MRTFSVTKEVNSLQFRSKVQCHVTISVQSRHQDHISFVVAKRFPLFSIGFGSFLSDLAPGKENLIDLLHLTIKSYEEPVDAIFKFLRDKNVAVKVKIYGIKLCVRFYIR